MIGNSWHLPTCRFLLFAVLLANQAISLQALGQDSRYTQVQTPLLEVRFHPDGSRPLCRMASFWRRSGINWDPKEPRQPQLQPPGRDEFAHFQWALSLQWLDLFPVNLNRCLQWALDMQQHMGASLQQWRDSVREDVQALVRELAEEQEAWMSAAPAHVIRVYKQGTGRNVVSLLVMAHLLQLFAFPEFELLVRDLFHSFPLLGPETLRSEVEAEAKKDRFVGPFGTAWLRANSKEEGDVPPYAGTQTVISQLRYVATTGQPRLFAVDHEGAYRSLPVRKPSECCTILPGDPAAVWMHQVLPFSSSGSVWSYIRVADALCFLSIVLLWLAAAHFVDDFFGCERLESADHGFQGFQGIRDSLTSCAAEPAKLAGKLGFATSWMFGSAYIFWLEMLAQVLALLRIRPQPGSHVLCFCDNVAAEHALRKGYSKDERFTKVLACFWSWVADRSLSLTFHRVSSKENCSDGVSRDNWQFADDCGFEKLEVDFHNFYQWLTTLDHTDLDVLVPTFAQAADSVSAHQIGEQRAEVA
ncbi:ftsH [Symbiodinium pilosum]|uniref:FtsH protein n=1 Tax=Symbiodinium pilosum TaxID=2952 RepID=A0A812VA03_SYMPI|nr:ftsH [Symbiodinium pilosum]